MNVFELLDYAFFRNALWGSLLASIACGIIGSYVVARRMVFISGGITHASFGGLGIGFYFGFYAITPILTLLFWLFGGIFFGIISSIVLYPIQPNHIEIEKNNFVIYQENQGFLGMCCSYEITEKQFLILEKKIKAIDLNTEIEFNDNSIYTINGKTELKIKFEGYQFLERNLPEKDTIILIKKE